MSSGGAQSLSGVFAQAIIAPFAPLRIELSARGDRWDNTDGHSLTTIPSTAASAVSYGDSSKSAFSPRVGVRYNLLSNLSFHAAYYRAFRAPNLAELYRKQVSPTSITIPNPFLKAENAEGREAGFDFQPIEWLQVKGTWYVADYNNFNVPTNLTATSVPPKPARVRNGRDVPHASQRQQVAQRRRRGVHRAASDPAAVPERQRELRRRSPAVGLAGDGDGRYEAAHQPRAVAEADDPRHVVVGDARRLDGDLASRGTHDDAAGRVARSVHGGRCERAARDRERAARVRVDREHHRQASTR